MSDQTVLALPAVSTAGSLTAFRWTDYDVPFWALRNTRPGRWHEVGDPPTQYWSMTPDAAWSELVRAEGLGTEEELDFVRMPLWACRVPAAGVVDLRGADQQDHFAVTADSLTSDSWSVCQTLGQSLRAGGTPGVIAPCASLPGHFNLTIFGARRQIDWRDRPGLARHVPAAVVAVGRPRPGLIAGVRRASTGPGAARLF